MICALTIDPVGAEIRCTLTPAQDLTQVVFCFSLMAPGDVVAGGQRVASVGGYTEVALPDLAAGAAHTVTIRYADAEFRPVNRAWLPLGPYLRHAGGVDPLTAGPDGVADGEPVDAPLPEGLRLVPPVRSWRPAEGTLSVGALATGDDAFLAADALCQRNNLPALVDDGGVALTIEADDTLGEDTYALIIAPEGITLRAGSYGGRFCAAMTLVNLRETHGGQLPCGEINDAPRFNWRGQHLDCARHFYEPRTILRLLDLMALLKLNRFHWHFADDEAFRLEITCLPELWQKTALRGEGLLIPGVFGGGIRSGGSYSLEDARAIVAHAKALNIEVMPEIEVPAHALALNRAVSGLRDPDDTGTEASVQGYSENVVNPALPRTWEVLEAIATEVGGLFPFGHLHLGCDELPAGTWDGSPLVDDLKAREGLVSADDVSGWTMFRLAETVVANGQRPAAWEEAARGVQGGIGHGALLFSWSGQGPGIEAARKGYDVVMTPAQHIYFDMAHTSNPDDWGANWAAYVALGDTVDWDPVPPEARDVADRIKGVQGAFWSEFTTRDDQIEPMIAPRILGLACKAWEEDRRTTPEALRGLAAAYALMFSAIGWRANSGA